MPAKLISTVSALLLVCSCASPTAPKSSAAEPARAIESSSDKASGFRSAAELINQTIRANHYHPAELDNDAYRKIEKDVIALGDTAESADSFLSGFRSIWQKGPFSHVALTRADGPAAERLARLDTEIAGDSAVALAWQGKAAILTVNTMSGPDTIEKINAAYAEIAARGADKLVIDLRRNSGGAFAVVPLVGHLIRQPIDAGVFVSTSWYSDRDKPPGPADFRSATPWRGYSVQAFQADMLSRPLTSYRIDPMQPAFHGPVFVLTSGRSISAAEIAADALKAAGRATIVGEKTPGILLSSKRFDIPGGFHLIVPIADYYSISNGRIERVGVTPNVPVKADEALTVALGL
jgi:carboxyl-terminal processing protease